MLPADFNPTEHLVSTIRRVYNREVREWFRDVGPDDWSPDIATTRASARVACTHTEDDGINETILRCFLFHNEIRGRLSPDTVQESTKSPSVIRRNKPQIILYFQQDYAELNIGQSPVTGRISFRVMDETAETITRARMISLGQRIKTEFGNGGGFVWRKGRAMMSYSDWPLGYQLQLLVPSTSEGRDVIRKVLDVQGHVPDWEKANYSENEEPAGAYPQNPGSVQIAGETVKIPRRRPVESVRFQFATMQIPGLANAEALYDRIGFFANALVD